MKKLSIITTFYNCEKCLLRAVNSINSQIYDKNDILVEYILVDDCSTDKSSEILKKYILTNNNNVDFKLYKTNENLGCGGARKFGIQKSTGDYLMFLDGDDYYIHNDFIQRAINDIYENDADVVEYGIRYNFKNGKILNNAAPKEIIIKNSIKYALIYLFKENFIKIHVWSKILKRSLVDTYDYSTMREFEDVDTIPKWISHANTIIIKPTVEINYNKSQNSIVNHDIDNTRYMTCKVLCQYFNMFKDDKDILKAIYDRAMIDFRTVLDNHDSRDPMFNKMSLLNTYMLSFICPSNFTNMTFNLKS